MSKIEELTGSISKKFKDGDFDKFIGEVNFPKFKSFAPNVKLTFRFPITVLIGPNGGGKSSVLQAAWGMPLRFSTSRFWFSTPVDPIEFDPANQHRYWYTHYVKKLGRSVQCRKMCGRKRHGYWEPTRPAQKEGMDEMPPRTAENEAFMSGSGDRWNQVDRTPRYINSKAESSAFERIFYSVGGSSLEEKQDRFVKYSRQLKRVIDSNLKSCNYYRVERVKKVFDLSQKQIEIVNGILNKNYRSAKYISHALYEREFSPSVIFETEQRSYSECFAGSGELAVVNYVLALEDVKRFDLLLLDEPETSLHPGAQLKLIEYIMQVVKEKLVQVIISTHSPTFVEALPDEALIVLDESLDGVVPRLEPTKASAFHRLGHYEKDKITIITEDRLLEALVNRALERLPLDMSKKAIVFGAEVGASEMLSNQVRAYAQTDAKVLMVLDGDQVAVQSVIDIDVDDLSEKLVKDKIRYLKENNVSVVGARQDLRLWIDWCKKHIVFLEQICPEQIFLELLQSDHPLLKSAEATNGKFKSAVRSVLNKQGDERDSAAQASIFKFLLGRVDKDSNVGVKIGVLAEGLRKKIVELEKG